MEEKKVLAEMPPAQQFVEESVKFVACMRQIIAELKEEKKFPAMRTHISTLNSFMRFMSNREDNLEWEETYFSDVFTTGCLKAYQEWLLRRNASWDTVSTYMRRLQMTYNRMLLPGNTDYHSKLFAEVYTKVTSQTKRALQEEQMSKLVKVDSAESLPAGLRPVLAYFVLMFMFRGMPFIDLAHLRKCDVRDGVIVYCRHKTGRPMTVRIPKEAKSLIAEYKDTNPASAYLFPILDGGLRDEWELYQCYQKELRRFNQQLAVVANLLLPDVKLSSYTARHTWATLAFHMGTPIGLICKALGHSSVRVTETYLKPFENEKVDETNNQLLMVIGRGCQINRNISYNAFGTAF